MVHQAKSIVIDAALERVFAYVNDPWTLPDWMVGVIETHGVVGAGEGQQYEWTVKMVGLPLRGQNVVVEHVPNERASHQGIGMIESEWTNVVERHDEGTKVTIEAKYEIPVPVLGKLADYLTIRRIEREIELSLLNLKESLEG